MTRPLLSIVVPYAGSPDVVFTLQSLVAQTLEASRFEVVLVSEQPEKLEQILGCFHLSSAACVLSYRRPRGFTGHSAGPMRNLGARRARGRTLVFVDSDCVLASDCLERHLALTKGAPENVICGGLRELPAGERYRLGLGYVRSYAELRRAALRDARARRGSARRQAQWNELYSGNVALPRELFQAVGGFDEAGHRCHDMDLGYRLHRAGASFLYAERCEVVHLEHPRSVASRLEQANGWRSLGQRYPEIRPLADDRALVLRRSWERVTRASERHFVALTHRLPGRRFGSVWTVPAGTDSGTLRAVLGRLPFAAVRRADNTQLYLRLDRNCWDFSILWPRPETRDQPVVSVVIPAYNAAATLERAVASVLLQTLQSFEILVVDDASRDATEEVLARLPTDGRLRFLSSGENRGLAWTLNRALAAARAPLLLQLDADDWLAPEALELVHDHFRQHPSCGAVYGSPVVHRAAEPSRAERREGGWQVRESLAHLEYRPTQAPRAYRTELLRRLGGWSVRDAFEGRYFEDRLTLSRISEHAEAHFLDALLYHVEATQGSLSRGRPRRAAAAKLAILWAEANRRRLLFDPVFRSELLRGRFALRPEADPTGGWSVVIPARDRIELLRYSLRSWLQSDWRVCEGEILVVDDGSAAPLEGRLGIADPRIRVLRSESPRGAAWARNHGAASARFKRLFFADADHIVQPDVLAVHERHHADGSRALVIGGVFGWRAFTRVPTGELAPRHRRRLLDLFQTAGGHRFQALAAAVCEGREITLVPSASRRLYRRAERLAFAEPWLAPWGELILRYGLHLSRYPHRWMRVGAGNLSLTTVSFRALGGFDERLQALEDWELGCRAQKSGFGILCAPDAEPLHQVHPRDPDRSSQERQGARLLEHAHPELVRALRAARPEHRPPGSRLLSSTAPVEPVPRRRSAYPSDSGRCALTFDDGPHPVGTPPILDVLRRHGARATFFVNGRSVADCVTQCRRIVAEGHEIGVHGWSHTPFSSLTTGEIVHSLERSLHAVERATGRWPTLVRPPYGEATRSFLAAAARLHLRPVGWHVTTRDWGATDSREIIARLALTPITGRIVLFHDGTGDPFATAEAVAWLLRVCRRCGIRPVGVAGLPRPEGRRRPGKAVG